MLKGKNKFEGRFKTWHVNRKGLITKSSSWKTRNWALSNGWEKIFGDVIRRDGVIGISDDFARNKKTRGSLRIGRSTAGNLERRGDRDWFKVSLKAGQRYQFDLAGKNLRDPYLYLRGANGKLISENDDGGKEITTSPAIYTSCQTDAEEVTLEQKTAMTELKIAKSVKAS